MNKEKEGEDSFITLENFEGDGKPATVSLEALTTRDYLVEWKINKKNRGKKLFHSSMEDVINFAFKMRKLGCKKIKLFKK